MALEDLTGDKYIDSLVSTNPVGATDAKGQGDDHIRGIKNVLKKTFPNLSAAVTATAAEINKLVGLTGTIVTTDTLPSSFATGDIKQTYAATAPSGWILMDDGTIGNAGSGASTRANADTEELYELLWNNLSDSYAAVVGGRGISAQADFDANKAIGLPVILGRAIAAAGAGSGLTTRALGESLGAETHQLTIAELASHDHVYLEDFSTGAWGPNSGGIVKDSRRDRDTSNTGSNSAHNNMQPTSFLNVMVKL